MSGVCLLESHLSIQNPDGSWHRIGTITSCQIASNPDAIGKRIKTRSGTMVLRTTITTSAHRLLIALQPKHRNDRAYLKRKKGRV